MASRKRPVVTPGAKFVRGKTRDGGEIRIYDDDAGGDYPIHGAYWNEAEKAWFLVAWTSEGFVIGKETPRSLDISIKSLKF
jgi:hypothetical protein